MAQFFRYPPPAGSILPAGAATSANQVLEIAQLTAINGKTPGFGTAGTPSANVLTIQGIGGMTPIAVTASGIQDSNLIQVGGIAITLGAKVSASSLPVVLASDEVVPISASSLPLPTGAATEATLAAMSAKLPATLGAHVTAASLAVNIASDQVVPVSASALPLPSGAATSALQTSGNASLSSIDSKTPALGQALAAASVPVVLTAAQLSTLTPLTSVTVTQATGTNLHAVIDSGTVTLSGTSVVSGTVTANQGTPNATPWNENVAQINGVTPLMGNGVTGTGSLRVTVASDNTPFSVNSTLQAGTALVGKVGIDQTTPGTTNAISLAQIGATTVSSGNGTAGAGVQRVTIASDNTPFSTNAAARTPTAGTITQAAITVGTSAVRLTVSGSAPSASRVVLVATPDSASTASFYIGSSSVTNSGANRGIQIVAGQTFIANSDAGDYYIISSTAAQTVYVMEQ